MKYLRLIEWRKYQHYKNRNPPWIKLHRDLLTSYVWTVLDDASRSLAIACMILASETDNKIPLDRDFIQRRGQFKKRPDIRQLVKVGFAEVFEDQQVIQDASEMLANASKLHPNHSPETERETEVEKEIYISAPKRKSKVPFPEDFKPSSEHYELARTLMVDCDSQWVQMKDWALGNGTMKANWNATFSNWLRRAPSYQRGRNVGGNSSKQIERAQHNARAIIGAFFSENAHVDSSSNGTGNDRGRNQVLEGSIARKVTASH